jgi:limonene-1,2-epoxide hydrolase
VASADQVVRAFFDAWTHNDPDEVAAFFTADAAYTDGPRGTSYGRDAIRKVMAAALMQFPRGFDVTIRSLVSNGRMVMVERTDRFEVAGRLFEMDVAGALEVNEDGLIARWRDYFDLKQIQDEITASLAEKS